MEKRGKPDRCQPWAMCDTMGPRCFQNEKVDAMAQNGQDEQVSSLVRIQQIMAPEQRPGVSDWMLFMTCWAVIAGVVAVLVRRDINESLTVAAGIVLLLGMFSSAGVFFAIGSKMWWPRAITAVSLLASGFDDIDLPTLLLRASNMGMGNRGKVDYRLLFRTRYSSRKRLGSWPSVVDAMAS